MKLWRYIGPYNWASEKDIFDSVEKCLHRFASEERYWHELDSKERASIVLRLRQNIGQLEGLIEKIDI